MKVSHKESPTGAKLITAYHGIEPVILLYASGAVPHTFQRIANVLIPAIILSGSKP